MPEYIDRLRAATQGLHASLEELPYARAVLDGSVPISPYASFLRASYVVHEGLERCLQGARGLGLLSVVAAPPSERLALIERDLRDLGVGLHDVDSAALIAIVLVQRMRLDALLDPRRLLGYVYVLEGSQLGGLVQHASLSKRSELAHGGLAYVAGRGRETKAAFEEVLTRLGAAIRDEATCAEAEVGAVSCLEGFRNLIAVLDPDVAPMVPLVDRLNPEAGAHQIPDDLREVDAALRAGEETFRAFSYYAARYGERGLRYTRSDSAWLVTLARSCTSDAERQIDWLAEILAARGMPSLLLARHLADLHQALVTRVPERAEDYAPLLHLAQRLSEQTNALPASPGRTLLAAFIRSVGPEGSVSPEEAGTLVIAAIADERTGRARAVASLLDWLADPARFSPTWIAAVEGLVAAARSGSADTPR